jgi:probable F420-dependent oxidoreductase
MARYGISFPLEGLPLLEQKGWIQDLEAMGYQELWSLEAQDVDGFTPLALASQWAPSMELGCAVFPVQTRGPGLMAMSVAALCEAAPGRFKMGIGCSSVFIVDYFNGIPFEKPFQYTRDMARFLKSALAGERINHEYESFHIRGFQLKRKLPRVPPILVGALREGMLGLAGREADGAILNFVTPEDLPKVIPHVRKHGEDKQIVVRLTVSPGQEPAHVRKFAKPWIAGYFSVPTYRAQQEWLGRGPALEKMWKLWGEGDRGGALAAIPDEVADAIYPSGPAEGIRERLQRYFDAGADTVILQFLEQAYDAREASRLLAPG